MLQELTIPGGLIFQGAEGVAYYIEYSSLILTMYLFLVTPDSGPLESLLVLSKGCIGLLVCGSMFSTHILLHFIILKNLPQQKLQCSWFLKSGSNRLFLDSIGNCGFLVCDLI